jgi:hypothetical protein
MVDRDIAEREMLLSRQFLSEYFDTDVVGFRAPYNIMIGTEEEHAKALEDAGYSYFTQFGEYTGKVPGTGIIHKQWNGNWKLFANTFPREARQMVQSKEYLITLDHPWNIIYQDGEVLYEAPELKDSMRANMLTAISNGGLPVLAKDLRLHKD